MDFETLDEALQHSKDFCNYTYTKGSGVPPGGLDESGMFPDMEKIFDLDYRREPKIKTKREVGCRQATIIIGNGNLFFLACGLFFCRHIQDTIGINVKSNFDTGHTTGCRGDTVEVKTSKKVVVPGHSPLTFKNFHCETALVVLQSSVAFSFFVGDSRVPFDDG